MFALGALLRLTFPLDQLACGRGRERGVRVNHRRRTRARGVRASRATRRTVAVVRGVVHALAVYPEAEHARHVALSGPRRDELRELHEKEVGERRPEIGAVDVCARAEYTRQRGGPSGDGGDAARGSRDALPARDDFGWKRSWHIGQKTLTARARCWDASRLESGGARARARAPSPV